MIDLNHAMPKARTAILPVGQALGSPEHRTGRRARPASGTGEAAQPVELGECYDAELVLGRLEEAGMTLLSIPDTGWSTKLRNSSLDIVRSAAEAYGWNDRAIRPPVPSAARIDRMDEALAWIPLIPAENYVLRRIVGARCLINPMTERHLFPWRRLAVAVGADHKAVQRWHAQGIDRIVTALNQATR